MIDVSEGDSFGMALCPSVLVSKDLSNPLCFAEDTEFFTSMTIMER